MNSNATHSPNNSTSKKFNEIKMLKEKYERRLEEMREEHEDEMKIMASNFEQSLQKLNDERELLTHRVEEITKTNEQYEIEIENLKVNFVKELKTLQSCQEFDINKMEHELSKMKFLHESEVGHLKESNLNLEKVSEFEFFLRF